MAILAKYQPVLDDLQEGHDEIFACTREKTFRGIYRGLQKAKIPGSKQWLMKLEYIEAGYRRFSYVPLEHIEHMSVNED